MIDVGKSVILAPSQVLSITLQGKFPNEATTHLHTISVSTARPTVARFGSFVSFPGSIRISQALARNNHPALPGVVQPSPYKKVEKRTILADTKQNHFI